MLLLSILLSLLLILFSLYHNYNHYYHYHYHYYHSSSYHYYYKICIWLESLGLGDDVTWYKAFLHALSQCRTLEVVRIGQQSVVTLFPTRPLGQSLHACVSDL